MQALVIIVGAMGERVQNTLGEARPPLRSSLAMLFRVALADALVTDWVIYGGTGAAADYGKVHAIFVLTCLDFGGLCHVQLMEAVVANVEPLGEEEIEAAGVEAEMGQWGAPEEWSVVYHSLVLVEKVGPSSQRRTLALRRTGSLFEP